MPAISVLLPCYNASNTLEESLTSLSSQTFNDYEIVAVDDGSSDTTLEILQDWSARDRRIKVLSSLHRGIVHALNKGLQRCCSPLVARMDADDRCHPERLARQYKYLDSHPGVSLVSCQVAGFPQNHVRKGFQIYIEWLNGLITHEDICREIFIESPIPHPSVMFRRADVLRVGTYSDKGWAEDYDLWLRMYLKGMRFAKLPERLLEWRERTDRLTRSDSRYSLENFLRAKAFYLSEGPLKGMDAVFVWGAGMIGRRLSKHLLRNNNPLVAFIDVDKAKIGRTLRELPIISPEALSDSLAKYRRTIILSAVGARGARLKIREFLAGSGLSEGRDWLAVA